MKNYLCFLPSIDEGGQKKTFLFFEHLHNGIYKSDQIGSTDRAVGLIKCALSESARNIAIDTSTNSGRNLLHRILPFTKEQGAERLYLASLFRRHYTSIQNYWHAWETLPIEERKTQDSRFMELFSTVRTLGGIRPLTALDRLVIQAWRTGDDQVDSPFAEELLKHPVAMYLSSVVQAIKDRRRRVPVRRRELSSEEIIVGITHNLCHLVQDPFPLDDSENVYARPSLRLFQTIPPEKERHPLLTKSPEDIVYNVIRGDGKDKDILKKYNYALWSLIVSTRRLLDNLLGGASRGGPDISGIFRKSCVFEHRVLILFDQMLNVWTESLMPDYHNGFLSFVDHEIFSKNLAPIVLEKCKEFLER